MKPRLNKFLFNKNLERVNIFAFNSKAVCKENEKPVKSWFTISLFYAHDVKTTARLHNSQFPPPPPLVYVTSCLHVVVSFIMFTIDICMEYIGFGFVFLN